MLNDYLRAEQELGRVDPGADVGAVATLIIGAIHGEILPRALFHPGGAPITTPRDFAERMSVTILRGIAPRPGQAESRGRVEP